MTPDEVSVALRTLSFVALFQAAGSAFFLTLFGSELARAGYGICRLGLIGASCGIVLILAHQWLDAARMADEFAGLFDSNLQRLAWISTSGAAAVLQAFGLLCVVFGLRRGGQVAMATLGATLAVAAYLLTGHTSVHSLRWLSAPLLAAHLLIVAFWFGALAPLYWVTQREPPGNAARIVARFSVIAGWLVPGILFAGLGLVLILVPDLSVLQRPYGLLLLGKLAGFALLMALAGFNKWRLTPALSAGELQALPWLRRSVGVEYLLIVVVLGLTAVLTTFYSPEH